MAGEQALSSSVRPLLGSIIGGRHVEVPFVSIALVIGPTAKKL
jgi:hypothetical protein